MAGVWEDGRRRIRGALSSIVFFVASLLVILAALFSSGKEVFGAPKLFVTNFTGDEKAVGLFLARNHQNEAIYVPNWEHHPALKYYSGKMIESVQPNSSPELQPPFWLILPTELLEENPQLKSLEADYAGKFLTLIHFRL